MLDPINISSMNAAQSLSEIANMAYGSGDSEGIAGGAGNIGLINGRVVKFNTHFKERIGFATNDMRTSCNELRTRLVDIARELLDMDSKGAPIAKRMMYSEREKVFKSICKDLGMSADGTEFKTKSLLDRTVVASVLSKLSSTSGSLEVWHAAGRLDIDDRLSSEGVDMHFEAVKARVDSKVKWEKAQAAKKAAAEAKSVVVEEKPIVYEGRLFEAGGAKKQELLSYVDSLELGKNCKNVMKQLIEGSNVPISTAFLDASAKLAQSMTTLSDVETKWFTNAHDSRTSLFATITKASQDFNNLLKNDLEINQALQGKKEARELFQDLVFTQHINRNLKFESLDSFCCDALAGSFLDKLSAQVKRSNYQIEHHTGMNLSSSAKQIEIETAKLQEALDNIRFIQLMQASR